MDIYRGDTKTIKLSIKKNGSPVDITGSTIVFTAKKRLSDSNAVIQKNAIMTSPEQGEAAITLNSDDTNITAGTYSYGLQMTDSENNVTTIICSQLTIKQGVTHD